MSKKQPKQPNSKPVVEKARELLAQGFTQNLFARDKDGKAVSSIGDEAVCWCSLGALLRAEYLTMTDYNWNHTRYADALERVRTVMGSSITAFNDSHSQEEVLAAFDKAIASYE